MKETIATLVRQAIASLAGKELPEEVATVPLHVERARDPRHGDFATNVAMTMSRPAKRPPRQIAEMIIAAMPASELLTGVEIAGPGFINFRLSSAALHREIRQIHATGDDYGRNVSGAGQRVIVEFVSANPTGPLHVGHGRHAAYGATVANLLEANGYEVHREYYVNDAGRQMDILATSVWLRYLELGGETVPFPSNAYRGGYIREIAASLRDRESSRLHRPVDEIFAGVPADAPEGDREAHIDGLIRNMRELLGEQDYRRVLSTGLDSILADIRDDLAEFGVVMDQWFSERSLTESGLVEGTITRLRQAGFAYEKDGALWFRATDFGDEKDRVLVRENGQTTYIASDIAYHLDKRQRGFDRLLDVLGADHHGYVARVRAGLEAMGEPGDSLEVRMVQFAVLYRGGEKVQMSTRSGDFVTLRELREEVGDDAARLFYVLRSNDQHLDFDLELAKSRTAENPVYYIQYAHARISSVFRQLREKDMDWSEAAGLESLGRLTEEHEIALMTSLSRFPEIIELAAANRAPQSLVHYLRDLAYEFHTYYNAHTFLVPDEALRNGRLTLITAVQVVIRNGLALLGVSAPDSM
ncbi:MAG: arginine--tRNA ligase [Gammaproteobacteria bacterium SG8_31]|nr:MAG: arginine--tRNA ligase [Gammaproteobacteria bacterium SG8_31]